MVSKQAHLPATASKDLPVGTRMPGQGKAGSQKEYEVWADKDGVHRWRLVKEPTEDELAPPILSKSGQNLRLKKSEWLRTTAKKKGMDFKKMGTTKEAFAKFLQDKV